jgi:hypothetical protein
MSAPKRSKPDAHPVETQSSKKSQSTRAQTDACSCSEMEAKQSQASRRQQTQQSQTKIVVKCNCGFTNKLFIRGEGVQGLSWDKGTLMKCTKPDEWEWETSKPFNHAEVKIVLNDDNAKWEQGPNHAIDPGNQITFSPKF